MHWLKEADLNTKLFHLSATTRSKFKSINMILNEDNQGVNDQVRLCDVAKIYFNKLLAAKEGVYDAVMTHIQLKINMEDNTKLLAPFTKAELYEAMKHMHQDKSSRLDGFNPTFYHNFWEVCGDDLMTTTTR
ncbi:unnamed protein product [Lathyrus sativus]|nr:unnamed protein product [Lathyrus sativus]